VRGLGNWDNKARQRKPCDYRGLGVVSKLGGAGQASLEDLRREAYPL
jgi:hypothetical protein